ncbi:hypothetical protein [Streptomyces sp. NPDC020965]|uniref:hypothetical protein n=1 Tax=Streptomyces sp. NPDC020965 TaxID=3365105 RepID=UPI0037ABC626
MEFDHLGIVRRLLEHAHVVLDQPAETVSGPAVAKIQALTGPLNSGIHTDLTAAVTAATGGHCPLIRLARRIRRSVPPQGTS